MKILFVTGVSSGIGQATAKHFLDRGDLVVGTCRNLNAVSELQQKYPEKFIPCLIDLADLSAIDKLPSFLKSHQIPDIDILVNNAGVALAAPFEFQNFSEVQNIIQVNVLSLMKVTQVLIPNLKVRRGRIINISSISGVNGAPFLAIYCASKHAVEGFSEALRREMMLYGIKVVVVGPGSIKTPIWDKGFQVVKDLYKKTPYAQSFQNFVDYALKASQNGLPAEDVVADIVHAVDAVNPCLRYTPIPQKMQNWYIPKLIPVRVLDRLIAKLMGLHPQK